MLTAGSTNEVHYATTVAGVATQADTLAVVVTDAAGATVTLGDTPTWNALTSLYDLTIASTECTSAHAGTVWTFTWTWTHGATTLLDVETVAVVVGDGARLIADVSDLTTYGYTTGADFLARASVRVRGYLAGRATAVHLFETPPVASDALVELVCAIAARMASADPSVVSGVRSEGSGAESVTYGAEAYSGTVDLNGTEKKRLDRLYPSAIRTVEL